MYNKLLISILLLATFFIFPISEINALESNNKYGIHIIDENDLDDATRLVNSSGGDWGYVTLVIRKDERDIPRWQRTFDKMRRLHLIPIVRIASDQSNDYWEKLDEDDINSWVYFLNSLNWVVKDRYVIVGNEPNHSTEWGGETKPEEYADYLFKFTKALNNSSDDFFVMPAGFDASAPNDSKHMDEEEYLRSMFEHNPEVFEEIEGWSSHSYPNPGFSGNVDDTGRISIKTYEWELNLLKKLGVKQDLPVFITETGWIYNENNENEISENYVKAFTEIWNDSQIRATTPFILNYTGDPFGAFSWKKSDGSFATFFNKIQEIEKVKGNPYQITNGQIKSTIIPDIIASTAIVSELTGKVDKVGIAIARNTGQSIWEKGVLTVINKGDKQIIIEPVSLTRKIEPEHSGLVFYTEEYPDELLRNSISLWNSIDLGMLAFGLETANTMLE